MTDETAVEVPYLSEALRARADEIDRAVSRNKDEIEAGAFAEIELMRKAAATLDGLQAALEGATEDIALLAVIRRHRALRHSISDAVKEIAEIEKTYFPELKS